MAKDRFKNRRSYDTEYKVGGYYQKPMAKRTITEEQTNIMNDMLRSGNLTEWEFPSHDHWGYVFAHLYFLYIVFSVSFCF